MQEKTRDRLLHDVFELSIAIKAIDGVLEIVAGLALLFATTGQIHHLVHLMLQGELARHPHAPGMHHLAHAADSFSSGTKHFATAYLLVSGAVKVAIVTGLWLQKLWVYPVAAGVLGLFTLYQCYRLTHTHSWFLAFLTVVNMVIIALLWRERNRVQRARER